MRCPSCSVQRAQSTSIGRHEQGYDRRSTHIARERLEAAGIRLDFIQLAT